MSRKLTAKQQDFRTAYIRSKTKNATEAARAAGYKHPSKMGSRLTKVPAIKAAIEATEAVALQHAIVDEAWVLSRIKECAERCMQEEPVLDKLGNLTGEWRFDSSGANRSLELLGKNLKLFTDRIEIESAQIEQLLGLVTSILKRTLPEDIWPKVAAEFARASEIYGSNDAELS